MTALISTAFDWPRIRRLLKEGGWIAFGQVTAAIGALVLVRVLTEHLDPEQYGQLALSLTVAGLVTGVVFAGVAPAISRFYPIAVEKKDLSGYLAAFKELMLYVTVVVVAIGIIFMIGMVWLGHIQWLWLGLVILAFALINGYGTAIDSIQTAARQRKIVAFHKGLNACLKLLLVFGMLLLLGKSSLSVAFGFAFTSIIVIVSQYIFLRRHFPSQTAVSGESAKWKREMWAYSWPFLSWAFFSWAEQSSARWALESYETTSDVGKYAVLFQLGYTPMIMILGFAVAFLQPIIFSRAGDTSDEARNETVINLVKKLALTGAILTGCVFAATFFLHENVIQLLTEKRYHSVSEYLPWMVLSGGIFAIGQMFALRLQALMIHRVMVLASILSSVIGFLSSFICVFYLGWKGAVASSLIHALSYLILILLVSRISLQKKRTNYFL